MGRTKVKARALPWAAQSRADVVAAIARIGAIEAQMAAAQAEADAAVRAAGEALERAIAQPAAEAAELRAGVQVWCEAHRAEITGGKVKFHDFGSGRVLWRLRPPRVAVRGTEAVIDACRRLGLTRFLREKAEVNKEAMLAEPELAGTIQGVAIASEGEDFVIEPAAAAEVAP